MTVKSFILPVTAAPPPPGVPIWWNSVSAESIHPTGTWQVYGVGTDTTVPVSSGVPNLSVYQRGQSMYQIAPTWEDHSNYTAMAVDQQLLRAFCMGGGHDGTDNRVVMLDFSVDTPRWWPINPNTSQGQRYQQPSNGHGQHQWDYDAGNGRIAAFHFSQDLHCHNGYLWITGPWASTNNEPGANYLCGTTSTFRMQTNQTPGTTFTWERIGRAIDIDGYAIGEAGATVLLETQNKIWKGAEGISDQNHYYTYDVSTLNGATSTRYVRGAGFTLSGLNNKKVSLLPGQCRFGEYSTAAEIVSDGVRPLLILSFTWGQGALTPGWWLFDPNEMNVAYGPIAMNYGAGVPTLNPASAGAARGNMQHLWGTNKLYICWANSFSTSNATFGRITIPSNVSTPIDLANSPDWHLDLVSPGGAALPPNSAITGPFGRFSLVRNMGDGRPAIIFVTIPWGTYGAGTTCPHVWICKMPFGGL